MSSNLEKIYLSQNVGSSVWKAVGNYRIWKEIRKWSRKWRNYSPNTKSFYREINCKYKLMQKLPFWSYQYKHPSSWNLKGIIFCKESDFYFLIHTTCLWENIMFLKNSNSRFCRICTYLASMNKKSDFWNTACLWRISSSGIWRRVVRWVSTDVSEKYIAELQSSRQACHLFACWFLAELIFSTLKMEAICLSETSVETQRTTRRHVPEENTLHNHHCGNLKSYTACLPLYEYMYGHAPRYSLSSWTDIIHVRYLIVYLSHVDAQLK
jgi:hypothetical protein